MCELSEKAATVTLHLLQGAAASARRIPQPGATRAQPKPARASGMFTLQKDIFETYYTLKWCNILGNEDLTTI